MEFWAILGVIVALAVGYLTLAVTKNWPPFSNSSIELRLSVGSEVAPEQTFTAEGQGDRLEDGLGVWLVGRDGANWFPYDEMSWQQGIGAYGGQVTGQQIPSLTGLRLHLVVADATAAAEFADYLRNGPWNVGLEGLPDGAQSVDSLSLEEYQETDGS